jgi:hypothetical protein
MTTFSAVISSLNLLVISITALFLYARMKRNHKWDKKYASQEILFKSISDDINDTRKSLEEQYDISLFEPNSDFYDDLSNIENEGDFKFKTKRVLNFLEMVSAGIKNGIVEEEVCYEYLHVIFVNYYKWSKPYIEEIRGDNRPAYMAFEEYSERWIEKSRSEDIPEDDDISLFGEIL